MGHSIELALRQSIHRVIAALVIFLPGLVAFLLAIIVLALIGSLLAALTRKVLESIRFDEKLAARQSPGSLTNISDWSPANSPTLLISPPPSCASRNCPGSGGPPPPPRGAPSRRSGRGT